MKPIPNQFFFRVTRLPILANSIVGCLHCPNLQIMSPIIDADVPLCSLWGLTFNKSHAKMPTVKPAHLIIKQKIHMIRPRSKSLKHKS